MIKISIIVPVYNVELYLRECLDSILNNNFKEYEIICVEDASSDKSLAILKEYATQNAQMKIIRHEINRGLSAARNTGIEYANGKYILFVDADDFIVGNMLSELYALAEQFETDIIYFDMMEKNEEGFEYRNIKKTTRSLIEEKVIYSGKASFVEMMEKNSLKIEACRQFINRGFLKKNKLLFRDAILHEDNLFSFLCAMKAGRVIHINKQLYIYRRHSNSIMSTKNNKRAESLLIVFEQIYRWWEDNYVYLSEEENRAVGLYLEKIYGLLKNCQCYVDRDNKACIGNCPQQFLFNLLMTVQDSKYLSFSKEAEERIKNATKLIVYGAGAAAREAFENLNRNQIQPIAVAVTRKENNPDFFCGCQVWEIEMLLEYREEATVLVAISEKYRTGIMEKLQRLGFKDIIVG